jgi:hypothetical protein
VSRLRLFLGLLWRPYEHIRIDWATAWAVAGIIHSDQLTE